jgi:hypothetical protein
MFLATVIESLVQVCLPRSIGQIGIIHLVSKKCLPKSFGQNEMITKVPPK